MRRFGDRRLRMRRYSERPYKGILLSNKKRQYLHYSVSVLFPGSYKNEFFGFSSSGRGRQGRLWRLVLGKWILGFPRITRITRI